MPTENLYAITEEDLPAYLAVISREKTNRHGAGGFESQSDDLLTSPQRPQVAVLTADLPHAKTGRAVIVNYVPETDAQIWDLCAVGWPRNQDTFRVLFNGVAKSWPYTASAADVARELGLRAADVCLGSVEDFTASGAPVTAPLARWRVRFAPSETVSITQAGAPSTEFGVRIRRNLFFEPDTRLIRSVVCPLSLPFETPARCGAEITFQRFAGFNGIMSVEPRYFVTPFGQPYYSV